MLHAQLWPDGQIAQIAVGFGSPPFDAPVEAPTEIIVEPDRWRYESGRWRYYPLLTATVFPNPVGVNSVVTVTATFPTDTLDTEATFTVEGGAPAVEPIQGQATHAYVFTRPGTYRIAVSSKHHGGQTVEVVVQ